MATAMKVVCAECQNITLECTCVVTYEINGEEYDGRIIDGAFHLEIQKGLSFPICRNCEELIFPDDEFVGKNGSPVKHVRCP